MSGREAGIMIRQLLVSPEVLAVEQALGESMMEVTPAARGAELLDERFPGWADRINLDIFDIRNGSLCVLGQVFGADAPASVLDGYSWSLAGDNGPLKDLIHDDEHYGFSEDGEYQRVCDARPEVARAAHAYPFPAAEGWEMEEGWALLQADWVVLISARQEQRVPETDLAVSGD